MPCGQVIDGVGAHADFFGQEERVGDAELVKATAALHGVSLALVISGGLAPEDALEFGVVDVLTDQPTAIGGVGGHIAILTRKELLMVDVVAVLR